MTPNDNSATIRAALAAFNANDVATLERLVDPDFVYIVRGHSSLSGEYRGWDAWAKGLARIKELTAGSMAATPEVILADDDHVMMYARFTGSRPDGRTYNSHQAYLYRLKDGRLLEGQSIYPDLPEIQAEPAVLQRDGVLAAKQLAQAVQRRVGAADLVDPG